MYFWDVYIVSTLFNITTNLNNQNTISKPLKPNLSHPYYIGLRFSFDFVTKLFYYLTKKNNPRERGFEPLPSASETEMLPLTPFSFFEIKHNFKY